MYFTKLLIVWLSFAFFSPSVILNIFTLSPFKLRSESHNCLTLQSNAMTQSSESFCEGFYSYLRNWERTNNYPVGDKVYIWSLSVSVSAALARWGLTVDSRLAANSWCWCGHVCPFLARWDCCGAQQEEQAHLALHGGCFIHRVTQSHQLLMLGEAHFQFWGNTSDYLSVPINISK